VEEEACQIPNKAQNKDEKHNRGQDIPQPGSDSSQRNYNHGPALLKIVFLKISQQVKG